MTNEGSNEKECAERLEYIMIDAEKIRKLIVKAKGGSNKFLIRDISMLLDNMQEDMEFIRKNKE